MNRKRATDLDLHAHHLCDAADGFCKGVQYLHVVGGLGRRDDAVDLFVNEAITLICDLHKLGGCVHVLGSNRHISLRV
jgi:hypothetical protein